MFGCPECEYLLLKLCLRHVIAMIVCFATVPLEESNSGELWQKA